MQFLCYLQTEIRIKRDSYAKSRNSRLSEEFRVLSPSLNQLRRFLPRTEPLAALL